MTRENIQSTNKKKIKLGIINFVLFILVMITGIIAFNMFVYPSSNVQTDKVICITENAPAYENYNTSSETAVSSPQSSEDNLNYGGLTVQDDTKIWYNNTKIDIFEHNDERVKSDGTGNADHVIAPGTSNNYTFSLQNDVNYAVKYTLEISGGNDSDYEIPVQVEIFDSDGNSMTENTSVAIAELNDISESGTLSPNTEKIYTIRWKWDFENGTDDYDTFLGNQAVNEEIACHININVISEYDYDNPDSPSLPSDDTPVITGDNTNIAFYIIISAVSIVIITVLIVFSIRKKKKKSAL